MNASDGLRLRYDFSSVFHTPGGLSPDQFVTLATALDRCRDEIFNDDLPAFAEGRSLPGKQPLDTAFVNLPQRLLSEYEMHRGGSELGQILDLLLTYVRDLVIAGEKHESSLLHEDRATLVEEAALLDEKKALQIFDRIFEAKDDIDKNVNMQIALEELCLDASALAGCREGTND